jgi:Holliday junction resolvasome RuvABC endonuclease subunit
MNLMGVDLGIHKVACFGWDEDIPYVWAWTAPETYQREDQLQAIAAQVRDLATFHDADEVWIEDTLVGNNVKYSMAITEVKGAVMAYLAKHTEVRLVNVQSWKKGTVGGGNASKDMVREYIQVSHGAYAPLCGDDQDLYDAACIALYGRSTSERARTLRLSDTPE